MFPKVPALETVQGLLQALGDQPTARRLAGLIESMGRPDLCVVVFGEFNRGKSTLINALLGRVVLPASLVPTTGHVTRVVYGPSEEVRLRFLDGRRETAPLGHLDALSTLQDGWAREDIDVIEVAVGHPLLHGGISLVDTPGVSDAAQQTARALAAIEQADLMVLLLDATQLLSSREHELAVEWMTRQLDKPLVPVLNRMNLVEESDRPELRQRLDRWCGGLPGPELGRPWFAVNALGALRHGLGVGPAPADDFGRLCEGLAALRGEQRHRLQRRSRRGRLLAELRVIRDHNARTLQALRSDADRVERERCGQRERAEHLLRRLTAEGRLLDERLSTFAECRLQVELRWLLRQIGGEPNARLQEQCGSWYGRAARDAVQSVEREADGALQTLAAEAPDLRRPDPLTIQERLTLNARIGAGSYLPTRVRGLLGDRVADWLEG